MMDHVVRLDAEIEEFYESDPDQTRKSFNDTVEKLKTLTATDWFTVRSYNTPPPLVESLMSAVCILMGVKASWTSAQNMLGSSVQNMEKGDEEALHCKYDCKLVFKLEAFDVYSRVEASNIMAHLGMFMMDPRFKS
ncbi:unnamed protein product, partial [Chrysoparadoxa australica]